MTDLIATVQDQSIDSDYIHLFEIEYVDNLYARFTTQLTESLGNIQFRDSNGTARTYQSIPVKFEGIDVSADGSQARPTITIANVLNLFRKEVGSLDYEDLIGRRITRRTTLKKYLVGESGDTGAGNAPIEFPKVTFIIDRIASKTRSEIIFELSAPHDLEGIMLPRRIIIGGACPWKYTGADPARGTNLDGGCTWKQSCQFRIPLSTNNVKDLGLRTIYVNKEDEYVLFSADLDPSIGGVAEDASVASTFKLNNYYYTEIDLERVNTDGSTTTESNVKEYWQCVGATTNQPSDTNSNFRRIRVYTNFVFGEDSKAYTQKSYNEYKLFNDARSGKMIWQTTRVSVSNVSPSEGKYWTRGDSCGKKLESCRKRYLAIGLAGSLPGYALQKNDRRAIPFGGFPGAKQNR